MDYYNVAHDLYSNHGHLSGEADHVYVPDGTFGAVTIDDKDGSSLIVMPSEIQHLRITPIKEDED